MVLYKQQDNKRKRLSTSSASNATTKTGNRSSAAELHVVNANDDTIVENMDSLNSYDGGQLRRMASDFTRCWIENYVV